jgi:hypothetical protein
LLSAKEFAECERVCRVPNIAHLAKTEFAECGTRKNKTLGKDLYAECLAVGKDRHSANTVFVKCFPLGKMLHLAKIARGERHPSPCPLPSASSVALGKVITLARVPNLGTWQSIFFWFLATKFFVKLYCSTTNDVLKFGTLSLLFGIFL